MSRRRAHGHQRCLKCNRHLTDRLSRKRGYGPVCFDKTPSMIFMEREAEGQLRLPGIE